MSPLLNKVKAMELSEVCVHRSDEAQLFKRIMLFQNKYAVNNERLERRRWNRFCRGYLCCNSSVSILSVSAGEV